MIKKFLYIFTILFSFIKLQADDVSEKILELQRDETVLVDNIYDHKEFSTELWNEIILVPRPYSIDGKEDVLSKISNAIISLDYALKLSDILLKLQEQLVTYYSVHNKNSYNLGIANKNKQISRLISKDIIDLKSDFITKRDQINNENINNTILSEETEFEIDKWTSIPSISDKQFRDEVFNYYTGGANKFIHTKPIVLIFYDASQEPSINQLLNIEDNYEQHRDKIDFYIVSSIHNRELLKVFKVSKLPTIYYLNMNSKLLKHVGTKGYSDIEDMLKKHFN